MSYGRANSYPWRLFDVALLPTSLEHNFGAVTRWRDESGHGRHAAPTGTVAYDGEGIPAAVFDTACRLDGSIAGADLPCTIWLLVTPAQANAGGSQWILDLKGPSVSDTCQVIQSFTTINAFRGGSTGTGATFSPAPAAPVLIRADFILESVALWLNHHWRGGAGISTGAAVALSAYRLGKRRDTVNGTLGWAGKVHGLWIKRGAQTDEELDHASRVIGDFAELDHPFAYPFPAANTVTTNPRLVLPRRIDMIAGRPEGISFWKTSLADRNGASSALGFRSTLQLRAFAHDRWTVASPSAPGAEHSVTIFEGAESATATINCVPMLTAEDSPTVLELLGDSNVAHLRYGFGNRIQGVFDAVGNGQLVQVGSFGPVGGGYIAKNTGIDGSTIAGTFNAEGSPLWAGGDELDMEAHFASLDEIPTHFGWLSGYQNAVHAATTDLSVEAACDAEEAAFETILAHARAVVPSLKVAISTGFPQNSDPASGWLTQADWYVAYRKHFRARERILAAFDGRDDVSVIDTFPCVDPVRGYRNVGAAPDPIHVNMVDGHRRLCELVLAWAASHR